MEDNWHSTGDRHSQVLSRKPVNFSGAPVKQHRAVQIFVRSRHSKCYLSTDNEWLDDSQRARCFRSALEAELVCRELALTGIDLLVLRRNQPPLTVPLTLP
jgi:hypothetical protein